jgi:hypothetical protein
MSLLTRGVTGLSSLVVDSNKDWLGHLIKNLGAPADDGDALRKQDAVLRSLLTQAGQIIYASAPGTPVALAPQSGDKYLKTGTPPSWSDLPAGGGFWQLAGQTVLSTSQGIIEVTNISTTFEILWVILMSSWSHGYDIVLRLNNDSGGNYDYSRFLFADVFARSAYDNATGITLAAPGGEGSVFYQFQGLIFQRLANWRKTFGFTWYHSNSANGSNSYHSHQGYWNNLSSKVTSVRFSAGSGNFDAGAKLVVLGT